MTHLFGLRPPATKGWKLHSKYSGRKQLIRSMRELKTEGKKIMPVRVGHLSDKFPYEIYIKVR